jgi:DNA ligase 1
LRENGKLRTAGVLELGTSPTERKAFYRVASSIIKEENNAYVYIEQKIKARVKIRNCTRNNMLRTPAFDGFLY